MGKKIIYFAALLMLVASCGTQKSISFLGESYTTFEGYSPEGNAIWYFCPPDTSRTDVSTDRRFHRGADLVVQGRRGRRLQNG